MQCAVNTSKQIAFPEHLAQKTDSCICHVTALVLMYNTVQLKAFVLCVSAALWRTVRSNLSILPSAQIIEGTPDNSNMEPPKKLDNPNPKGEANPISKLLFLWVEIFILKGKHLKINISFEEFIYFNIWTFI